MSEVTPPAMASAEDGQGAPRPPDRNKKLLSKDSRRKITWFWIRMGVLMFVVVVLLGMAIGPLTCGIVGARQSGDVQIARTLALALFQYSNDHGGHYPPGATSTEVFQHLMDEGYANDPSLFYPNTSLLPGKVRGTDRHLKAENVGWDVTGGVDSSAPDDLPLVYSSGFKVSYEAGSSAVLLNPELASTRTWARWWNGEPNVKPFMAVCIKGHSASAKIAQPDGTVPNFIPADFDAKGKVYRQLTP